MWRFPSLRMPPILAGFPGWPTSCLRYRRSLRTNRRGRQQGLEGPAKPSPPRKRSCQELENLIHCISPPLLFLRADQIQRLQCAFPFPPTSSATSNHNESSRMVHLIGVGRCLASRLFPAVPAIRPADSQHTPLQIQESTGLAQAHSVGGDGLQEAL
jgi:hypothetical protein